MIDRQYLEKERENLLAQQRHHLALYHQAAGAISMLDSLAAKLDSEPEKVKSGNNPKRTT